MDLKCKYSEFVLLNLLSLIRENPPDINKTTETYEGRVFAIYMGTRVIQ